MMSNELGSVASLNLRTPIIAPALSSWMRTGSQVRHPVD